MKKLTLILGTLLLILNTSCEVEPDCGCGTVQNVSQFNLPGGNSFGGYQLRNICTGEVTNYQFTGSAPTNGSIICNNN